jgi:alpha-mannosidase
MIRQIAFETKRKMLKGGLHCHTTRSDGKLSPEDTMKLHKENGYDFLAITDHRVYNFKNFAPELDLVAFDSEYIRMTAFKKAEDRESIIIRFFNSHTEELPLTLTLAPIFKSARLVDLGERVLCDLGAINKDLKLNVGAKKIVTLELTL